MFSRSHARLMAPIAVVAIVVAACSSGGSGSASGGSSGPKRMDPLSFAASLSAEDMPVFAAAKYGYFADEGIDFKQTTTLAGNATRTALLAGSIDMITSDTAAAAALNASLPITTIAAAYNAQGIELVMAKKYQQSAPPGAGGLSGLKGMKIGVVDTGGSTQFVPQKYLTANGYSADYVQFVPLGSSSAMIPALQSGKVDGISYSDPIVTQLVDQGIGYVQTNFGDVSGFWPAQILITSQKFYQANTDLLTRALKAIIKADNKLTTDHDFAVKAIEDILSITDAKTASDVVDNDVKYWTPTVQEQGWNNAVAYEQQTKAISSPVAFSAVTDSKMTALWKTATHP